MTAATPVYLDYNATGRVRPAVIEAVAEAMRQGGNASSIHHFGRIARKKVEDAREQVAALVGARPELVVFTGGGTEADNLAIRGLPAKRLIVSAIEHGAVLAPALLHDPKAVILPVDGAGAIDLPALEAALASAPRPALVSVMYANNETGVLQPMPRIGEIAHRHGAWLHSDCVQAAGKVPLDLGTLGADLISLSAHKLGGPQGVGALVLAADLDLAAQNVGGGQERGRRSGTENVPGIAGFGVAAALAKAELPALAERVGRLRDDLERRVLAASPGARVYGRQAPRLPNTSSLSMPGRNADVQVMAFDLVGIAISAGAACSSGKVSASHVLAAMGIEDDEAKRAIRVSLGWQSSAGDVDRFLTAWQAIEAGCGRQPDAA
ncbi:MAG: cysteine desulfurase [Alphaproteobacteria bacterium]|nr:cysteine desulfurase [Alphaproteobacteria bacterium]